MDNGLIVNDEKSVNTSITAYDSQLLEFINKLGLPTKNILVPVNERKKVVKNIEDAVNMLEAEKKLKQVIYQSLLQLLQRGYLMLHLIIFGMRLYFS